jgi:hypothetical protein
MSNRLRIFVMMLLVGILSSVPMFAASDVVGSVAGSLNASVAGQTLLPNTSVFNGDSLQVKEGAAVVTLDNGNRVALGRDTVAKFLRNDNAVTVVLTEGNVSLFHPDSQTAVKVQIGYVTVEPKQGFKTLGEVAMTNGTIVITAKDGTLEVNDGGGRTTEVAKGKTIALSPKTARGPQTGGSQHLGGGPNWVEYTLLGVAGVALIWAIIASSRAQQARSNALVAASNAAAAASAAAAAGSEAVSAVQSSQAVLTAAVAVQHAETVNVGCSLNTLSSEINVASPYTPLVGSCPATIATPF